MEKREVVVVFLALALLGVSMVVSNINSGLTGYAASKNEKVKVVISSDNKPMVGLKVYVDNLNDKPGRGYFLAGRTKGDGSANLLLRKGPHKIKISKAGYDSYDGVLNVEEGYNFHKVEMFKIKKACKDNTAFNSCSKTQPLFCNAEGYLRENCQICGCGIGKECRSDGSCA